MTIEIIDYSTRNLMIVDKKKNNKEGLRVLHTDFIDNDESKGYHVTFVKGIDDPYNSPEQVARREAEKAERTRNNQLKDKAKNKTLTKAETDELLSKLADYL